METEKILKWKLTDINTEFPDFFSEEFWTYALETVNYDFWPLIVSDMVTGKTFMTVLLALKVDDEMPKVMKHWGSKHIS